MDSNHSDLNLGKYRHTKKQRIAIYYGDLPPYDHRMLRGLRDAFTELGHSTYLFTKSLSKSGLAKLCHYLQIDVLIQINVQPYESELFPAHMRRVIWFQDLPPSMVATLKKLELAGCIRRRDILYCIGSFTEFDPNLQFSCMTGTLALAVDRKLANFQANSEQDLDFSICGFIPAPQEHHASAKQEMYLHWNKKISKLPIIGRIGLVSLIRRLFFRRLLPVNIIGNELLNLIINSIEASYVPLTGSQNSWELEQIINSLLDDEDVRYFQKSGIELNQSMLLEREALEFIENKKLGNSINAVLGTEFSKQFSPVLRSPLVEIIDYYSYSYSRLMDRRELAELAFAVSNKVELYGMGWEHFPQFKDFHQGTIQNYSQLLNVYSRSKINLGNNTHGIGLHSRNLECMAIGGFVFLHKSVRDDLPGGIKTSFVPSEHYGQYEPHNFAETAMRWIADPEKRRVIGLEARKLVFERHTWNNRAQQILKDLAQT